ncbi:hypothetical protein [Micromonospora rubida]
MLDFGFVVSLLVTMWTSWRRVARVGGEGRELLVLRECIRRMNRPTGPTPAQRGRRPGNQRPG